MKDYQDSARASDQQAVGLHAATHQMMEAPSTAATYQEEEKHSFLERNSLKLAGLINIVGDGGFLINGIQTKSTYKTLAGSLYSLGAANLIAYGSVDKNYVMNDVSERTAEFIKDKAGSLPDNTKLAAISAHKKTGEMEGIRHYLHRQPAQTTMGLYTLGAASVIGSGMEKYKQGGGPEELAYGVISFGSKLASFLIPEKSPMQEKREGVIGHIKDWAQEKPMRVFGYTALINDAILGLASIREYKQGTTKNSYMSTALSSGAFMLSDVMFLMSHKDPNNADGKLTHDEREKIVGLAAEVIAKQPSAERSTLVKQVADFLGEQPEIQIDDEVLAQSLNKAIDQMMAPSSWVDRTEASEATHHMQR